jgi:hypothetical protein
VAAANGNYTVAHLPAGSYFPISVLDSNGDGDINPDNGDAIGAYGADLQSGDVDSVIVGTSVLSNIDFMLYDPSVVTGSVNYIGSLYNSCCYNVFIGAFDTTGFDLNNLGDPDYGTEAYWPNYTEYRFNGLDGEIADGTYYVGAYLDGNSNSTLDPGEPMAFYGGSTPTPVTIADGTDAFHVDITLDDAPALVAGSWNVTAPSPTRRQAAMRRIADAIRGATR